MSSPAHQLLRLISDSLSIVQQSCTDKDVQLPDLDAPFTPSSEAFRADPSAAEAANIISAAALQLAAIFTPPQVSLYHLAGGHFRSAAVRSCLEANVTEILREAGPQGLHVKDISAKNGQDPDKLARFLRFLATHHVYRETEPDIFTNNRISSVMDTLKSSEEIIADPEHKYDGPPRLAALISHHLDEPFKASAYAWESLADPETGHSGDPSKSPFTRAFRTTESIWQFLERPEEQFRRRRFDAAMRGTQALQPADAILHAFDWKCLKPGSVVVDVGGGVGTSAFPIARAFPDLKVVVQDRQEAIDNGTKLWSTEMPEALNSGRVKLEGKSSFVIIEQTNLTLHDFFNAQPARDTIPAVFLLKQILHDWADSYSAQILQRLRDAAGPGTRLLVVDSVMPYACHDPATDGIPGAAPREAPAPLLANYGAVNEMGYNLDIDMFVVLNAQERTVGQFDRVLKNAGWKISMVHRHESDSTFLQSVEAVPI
ncbi:S-adenosyl-L-methionine-dependent methyltransferase [Dentipellis sp. KUC8613]|nr:S-adenosyl-L-methionine-dependent methyltransferase [Dentipellis sp. KUC8613]